jgi:thiamine-phosphate pyrophosphorylase
MPIPFKLPRFYPILDTTFLLHREYPVLLAAAALIEAGAKILQYRHKDVWTQAQFDEAKQINGMCNEAGVLFVLNDRADFAKLLHAALHVGQEDLPPVAARKIVGDEVMGFSTHNRGQLMRADEEPVEYLSLGPIFATTSKQKADPVVGIEGLAKLRPLTKKPLCAIGGITLSNVEDLLKAGADSIAVISSIVPEQFNRNELKRRAEEWIAALGSPAV